MERLCVCMHTPEGTAFKEGGLYRWEYVIDGYSALGERGEVWAADEIKFYLHFRIVSGKSDRTDGKRG